MPEEAITRPSGIMPEGSRITIIGQRQGDGEMPKKPTVINPGGSEAAQSIPTVIGSKPAAEKHHPTVIGTPASTKIALPASEPARANPTVIQSGEQSTREDKPVKANPISVMTASVSTPPKQVIVGQPSTMPGSVQRKPVEVSREELEKFFPGTPNEILNQVRSSLKGVILNVMTETQCMHWGMKQQEKYSELVNESLSLAGNKSIQDGSRHIGRLYVLLQGVALTFQDQGSGFAFWKKREGPLEKFQKIHPEIQQLSTLLRQLLPNLTEVQERLRAVLEEFQKLSVDLDVESIAARYLADQLDGLGKQAMAHRLLDRSLSLAQTVVHIQQGMITRQTTGQEVCKLISRIQNGVLVTLPAWIEQVSIAQTKQSLTDTEMYAFRQGFEEALNQVG